MQVSFQILFLLQPAHRSPEVQVKWQTSGFQLAHRT